MRFWAPKTKPRAGWWRRTALWAGSGPSTSSIRSWACVRSSRFSTPSPTGCTADEGVEDLPGAFPRDGLHGRWRTLRGQALESSGHGNGLHARLRPRSRLWSSSSIWSPTKRRTIFCWRRRRFPRNLVEQLDLDLLPGRLAGTGQPRLPRSWFRLGGKRPFGGAARSLGGRRWGLESVVESQRTRNSGRSSFSSPNPSALTGGCSAETLRCRERQ